MQPDGTLGSVTFAEMGDKAARAAAGLESDDEADARGQEQIAARWSRIMAETLANRTAR